MSGNVTQEELRNSEARLGTKIDDVRKETAASVGKLHDRVNTLDTASTLATHERTTMKEAQASAAEDMDKGRQAISDLYAEFVPMTGQIALFGAEMVKAREEKEAEKQAKIDAAEKEAEERKSWMKRWRDAATPQNIVALVVIVSAIGAFLNGEITKAELAAQVQEAALQAPPPNYQPGPVAPAPAPEAEPDPEP